ncbi:MAG: type II secretion system F family protein [Patescibacteria group bacterium]|jgi:type IV pilus assembly protein PilC
MSEFNYTARTQDGQLKKDRIRIKDKKALAEYLKNQNLILTSSKEIKKGGRFSLQNLLDNLSSVPIVQKIFFTQNLSIMVKTGFSLAAALKTLALQTTNKKFRNILIEIQQDVESGISFSSALAKYPKVFPELFVNMISAGEASGKLDEILIHLTVQMKKDHTIISKVRSAMMYPSVIVVAMVGIGVVMLITVIPQMSSIYAEGGTELPLPTKILLGFSSFVLNQGVFLLIAVFILLILFIRLKKTKKGKLLLHKFLLKLPIFGAIIVKINITRFSRTLSSLLKTDIPIVQTLQIISKTLGNIYFKNALINASDKVKKGISISKTLEQTPKLFSPLITQMINIGEESGSLDTISEQIANFYEEDVDQTMSSLSTIIEPILMLIIGAVVAFVALSVLMPMYGLVQAI